VLITLDSKLENQDNTMFWLRDIALLGLFIGLFYALWIGSYALFVPDEGRYSEVAREMVVSGDYITPRIDGVAFLDKPVLYYWLQASAIKLFGISEWSLRLWPVLAALLSTLVLYATGRLLYGRRAGLLAAVLLATSPLYYGAAHYANLDLEVASFVANSLLCFLAAMQGGVSARWKNILLFAAYAFAGAAALTKGLIGIVFPALIIGTWILLLNRWRLLTRMRLVSGLILFFVMTLPWYVLVQKANPQFLHFFFVTQQVSRFLTTQEFNSKAPLWFYLPVALAGFFPWTVFLVQALSQKCSRIWRNKQRHATDLFLLLWLSIIFVFFSIPHSKLVGYILPILPVLALIVGSYVSEWWDAPQNRGYAAAIIIFGLASLAVAAVFIAAPFLHVFDVAPDYFTVLRRMAFVLLVSAIVLAVTFRQRKPLFVISCLAATAVSLLLIFISSVSIINTKSIKPLALELRALLKPEDELVTYYRYFQDLPIYVERPITIVADWHAPDIAFNDNWLREIWYGMVFQDTSQWLIDDKEFAARWNSAKRLYVVTDTDYYQTLKAKMPVFLVGQDNDKVILTNHPLAVREIPTTY
jgi:4-amino-4-deoxy-L-arabinose transferase-like glycosyltransferase